MKIVLFQPEIPQNTGNIIRTCSVTNTELILVKPYGFSISNRQLKRAGLDYFEGVSVLELEDLFSFLQNLEEPFYFFSSKAKKSYTEVKYEKNTLLIFGSESKGLPPVFFETWENRFVKIPMKENARCLNLANSVAIGLYEALRQQGFRF
ncbi:MAG: tRNA (cytidine(34)-2'-O)-methyltransferase [Chlamydiae bacterium]|nr:tRNA (cytidine(34)-2'-O)-methyltransferase [Chlamydiota bacterium]